MDVTGSKTAVTRHRKKLTWRRLEPYIMHILLILLCLAVLFPILYYISHLLKTPRIWAFS